MRRSLLAGSAMLAVLSGCNEDGEQVSPTIGLSGFTQSAATPSFECQAKSTRLPWGAMAMRTWTPRRATVPDRPSDIAGAAYGEPFQARLIQAWGDDYGESRRTVILEMQDGCRRQFRTDSFSDADNALIAAEIAKRPTAPDPATYRIVYDSSLTSPELVESGELRLYQTQHFAFWYGNGADDSYDFYKTITQQGRTMEQAVRETAEQFERQWFISRDIVGAPVPFANSTDKQKLNIYLCGTGRPNAAGDRDGCGAGAGMAMGISAWALGKGSMVISHEFGHMIQYYTGGFRDSPTAGPIWETGAEWTAFAVSPHFNTAGFYLDNLEYGPLFSVSRYAAFPFMNYLYETDRTRPLVFDAWKTSVNNGAWSSVTRDFLPTLVQLGQKTGAYPQGFVSFANDMGWYGARLIAMDFFNQPVLNDGTRASQTTRWQGHFYTPLAAAGQAGTYTPPAERALRQWGTHLIPLTSSGAVAKVTLTGQTTASSAAWRFSIVAVKNGGTPVYSTLGAAVGTGSGSTSLTVPTGAKLYLAVTATPYRYESLGWQKIGDPAAGTRFPYSVKIEGATPLTGSVTACNPGTEPGSWTLNYGLSGNGEAGRPC
ncbi:DUF6055 domain-containing protein [Sphingomonas sp. Leaf343]|uniref:DUF6055 domain-containing protein n=1 Tax=Sphingomonas sp. Leaf343 TaxID=1736345 RepID=UPI000B261483|nr:DUF6055 domain-containing protein [Sphingomonas sp. Leaf343]